MRLTGFNLFQSERVTPLLASSFNQALHTHHVGFNHRGACVPWQHIVLLFFRWSKWVCYPAQGEGSSFPKLITDDSVGLIRLDNLIRWNVLQ